MSALRILVVDDEHLIVDTIAEVLSWDGHTVDRAGDGMEALARVEAVLPDVLIVDLMMPTMDGNATIEKLRATQRSANLPIVLMTAAPVRIGPDAPYDALLAKPFDITALRAALTKALDARRR